MCSLLSPPLVCLLSLLPPLSCIVLNVMKMTPSQQCTSVRSAQLSCANYMQMATKEAKQLRDTHCCPSPTLPPHHADMIARSTRVIWRVWVFGVCVWVWMRLCWVGYVVRMSEVLSRVWWVLQCVCACVLSVTSTEHSLHCELGEGGSE